MMPHAPSELQPYLARFGLESFRPGQQEVIETVLAGRDCLCVMPTGGGKSLCYQLPALVFDGLTLVVSPLIALMKDQVDQLQSRGIPVTFINSTLSMEEQYTRLERMAAGDYRLAYVVPERFRSSRFLEAVRAVGVKLLAVDEAHCVSEWGHDFRPDYARLGRFRRMLGDPPTIALTATATDAVRRDIVEQLQLRDPRTFITGFARPNLFYEVQNCRGDRQKIEILLGFLGRTRGSGIIYTSSRKKAEEVAAQISSELHRSTVVYHAGLLSEQRHAAQDAFMGGGAELVVATNAFGMGIDKADVRFVIHYNMPGTLEGYYQEAGRAGRDGKPSRCILLYNASDRIIQEFFIESAYPSRDVVAQVYEFFRRLEADPIQLTQQEIKERLGLSVGPEGVGACEQLLESAGVLERLVASQNMAAVRLDSDLPTLVDLLPKQAKVRRRVLRALEQLVGDRRNEMVYFQPRSIATAAEMDLDAVSNALRDLNQLSVFTYIPPFRGRAIRILERDLPFEQLSLDFDALERLKAAEYEKLNQVVRFALSYRCRQQEILQYFGDSSSENCGHCDNCQQNYFPQGASTTASAIDDGVLEAVRMALSGIARTQSRFRCGKNLIAQMLCGSNSARVEKLHLNTLSTFGLLGHLTQQDVAVLIDILVAAGLAQQEEIEPRRPVVQLTATGVEVMKGTATLEHHLPIPGDLLLKLRRQPASSSSRPTPEQPGTSPSDEPAPLLEAPDAELLAALKQWRRRVASEENLAHYMVLSNATLEELAQRRPQTSRELLGIRGIGPAKVDRYGAELLRLLAGNAESSDPEPIVEGEGLSGVVPTTLDSHPAHYWTWRLLERGFSVDDCATIRNLTTAEVLRHALAAVDDGLRLELRWCLPQDLLALLQTQSGPLCQASNVDHLLEQLPPGTSREAVELFAKCQGRATAG